MHNIDEIQTINSFLTHCSKVSKSINKTIVVNINDTKLVFNSSYPDDIHKFIIDSYVLNLSKGVENHES